MAQTSSQPSVTPTQLQPSSIRCYGCHRILAVIPHLMVFRCPACRLQHRLLPPHGPLPSTREEAPRELQVSCADCMAILVPHSNDDFILNKRFAHKMCYSGIMETDAEDVKPPKLERSTKTSIVSLKDNKRLKEVEEVEDCFILDFDPYESEFSSLSTLLVDDDDLTIVGEQGEVACRDYPHPRHLCVTNSFNNTPHYIHCNMGRMSYYSYHDAKDPIQCYCYVCDVPAPCEQWTKQSTYFRHCEAIPDNQIWTDLRISKRRKIYASFYECYLQDTSICHEANQ